MLDDPRRVALICGLGALALIYNVWAYSALWTQPKGVTEPAGEMPAREAAAAPHAAPPAQPELAALSGDEVSRILAALPRAARDPFRFADPAAVAAAAPAAPGEPAAAPLVLQGTLVGVRRIAWINQRALTEGEELDGHVLERIESGHVWLRRGDEELELWSAR